VHNTSTEDRRDKIRGDRDGKGGKEERDGEVEEQQKAGKEGNTGKETGWEAMF